MRDLTPYEIAENAIGLFLEFRDVHGQPEDEAKANTLITVVEALEDMATQPITASRSRASSGRTRRSSSKTARSYWLAQGVDPATKGYPDA